MTTSLVIILESFFQVMGQQSLFAFIVMVLILPVHYLTRHKAPLLRYAIWSLVFLRFLVPPQFAQPYSLYQLGEKLWTKCVMRGNAEKAGLNLQESHAVVPLPNGKTAGEIRISPFKQILFFTWCLGASAAALLLIFQRKKYTGFSKRACVVDDHHLLELLQEWRIRLGLRRKVRCYRSSEVKDAFTMGTLSPIVVLPATLAHEEAVLAHELVHIKRLDDLFITLQNLLQIIFYFHPAIWLARREIARARECLVDSRVLAEQKISRSSYGQSLIDSLKFSLRRQQTDSFLPGYSGSKELIELRIKNLKGEHKMKRSSRILFYGALILAAVLILPMSGVSRSPEDDALQAKAVITFSLPLGADSYRVSAKYGPMIDPFSQKERFHRGIDLAAPAGTSIMAAAAGTVTGINSVESSGEGSGLFIEIHHGEGWTTRYTHLKSLQVKEGDTVVSGQQIGTVGSTGLATGPHLHFEIWKDKQHVNPETILNF